MNTSVLLWLEHDDEISMDISIPTEPGEPQRVYLSIQSPTGEDDYLVSRMSKKQVEQLIRAASNVLAAWEDPHATR